MSSKTIHSFDVLIWGTPATMYVSDNILRWVFRADSYNSFRHRHHLMMQNAIKHKHFVIRKKVR